MAKIRYPIRRYGDIQRNSMVLRQYCYHTTDGIQGDSIPYCRLVYYTWRQYGIGLHLQEINVRFTRDSSHKVAALNKKTAA